MREELGVEDNMIFTEASSFNSEDTLFENQIEKEDKDINDDIEESLRNALESLDF